MSINTPPVTWRIIDYNYRDNKKLADLTGFTPLQIQLLRARHCSTVEEIRKFTAPAQQKLSPPSTLTDVDKAVIRIQRALKNKEHIRIVGDYDVDGLTATAIMFRALERLGAQNISYQIPKREDGYGIKQDHIHKASKDGIELLIVVDSGTSAHDVLEAARQAGIDVIIVDHHQLDGPVPDVCAFINPVREYAGHRDAHLCSAGLALKLAWALEEKIHDIDLAALGTIADVMPLQGENRIIVAKGINELRKHPRYGIGELIRIAQLKSDSISAEDIAFQLAPRLNAAGRMGDPIHALKLLLSSSGEEAEKLAQALDNSNEDRKKLQNQIFQEAIAQIEKNSLQTQNSIIVASEDWHPGVIGIVAGKIHSQYHVPSVVIHFKGEDGIGSVRSDGTIPLTHILQSCSELLETCGGHCCAGGLKIRKENFEEFKERFQALIQKEVVSIPPEERERKEILELDGIVSLSEIDNHFVAQLEQLKPFGHGNPPPRLCSLCVRIVPDSWREIGTGHLLVKVRQGDKSYDAIGFNMAEHIDWLKKSTHADIAFTPKCEIWRDETRIKLHLLDIRRKATISFS